MDPTPPPRPRTAVYIDGFNLYNGLAKPLNCKWVNLQLYFERVFPRAEIVSVDFFTALVLGGGADRQGTYCKALETLPKIKIHWGHFQEKDVLCTNRECGFRGNRRFKMPAEKMTDVAIAVKMLDDAYQDVCDHMVVISGDSDLIPAVRTIRNRFPDIRVTAYVPTMGSEHAQLKARIAGERPSQSPYARNLREACTDSRDMPVEPFLRACLPVVVERAGQDSLHIPDGWTIPHPRAFQDLIEDLRMKAKDSGRGRRE